MRKKLTLLIGAAIALVAFAVPVAAQGAVFKDVNGDVFEDRAIQLESTNLTYQAGGASVVCANVEVWGYVYSGGTIDDTSMTVTANCPFGAPGYHWNIQSSTIGSIALASGTGSANVAYGYQIRHNSTTLATCTLSGTLGFSYTSGSSTLHVPGSNIGGSGTYCPSVTTWNGTFSMKDADGFPVTIH